VQPPYPLYYSTLLNITQYQITKFDILINKKSLVFKASRNFIVYSTVKNPETGRTHQIRVHLAYLGHPVVGDIIYNPITNSNESLMLHAAYLRFMHPVLGKEIRVVSKLPASFRETLKECFRY